MTVPQSPSHHPTPEQHTQDKVSIKDQIIELHKAGITDVADLAMMTGSKPSYIGMVLQDAKLEDYYFDLYTSTSKSMNAYSKFFQGKMRYKDIEAAHTSVRVLDRMYEQFDRTRDRAGQHHAMMLGMTMANRARWSGKHQEAMVFQRWLSRCLASFDEAQAA